MSNGNETDAEIASQPPSENVSKKFALKGSLVEWAHVALVSVVALFTIIQMCAGFQKRLTAVVDGGHWKSQRVVVQKINEMDSKETKAANVNEITPENVNKITSEDIDKIRSFYVVKIHNKADKFTEHTRMKLPTALYWEVSWKDEEGERNKNYAKTDVIKLPDIQNGMDVNVKVWAASAATRSHAKEIVVTKNYGGKAHLVAIRPVWKSFCWLNRNMLILLLLILIHPPSFRFLRKLFFQKFGRQQNPVSVKVTKPA